MDMIRWLATNKVVLAVWGLGILAILLAAVFGGGKKAEPESAAVDKAVPVKVVEASKPAVPETTSGAAVTAAAATGAAVTTVMAAVGTDGDSQDANGATAEAVDGTDEPVAATDQAAAQTVTDTTVATESAATDEAATPADESANVADVTASDDPAATAVVASNENLTDKSTDDLLMMAREAYWNNGLEEAASLYSELITREPEVIEHKGELGNVLWRQGYPKKAAELYANIAEPMIAQGNGERVSNMIGFIGLFYSERAAEIRKLLDAQ